LIEPIRSHGRMERIIIDMVNFLAYKSENDNYAYILTAIDHFTGFCFGIPTKSYGPCSILQSDNGGEFVAKVILHIASTVSREGRKIQPNS